ncbi:MAG: hypothetical protein ACUZ8H_11895 [Candidatus Anammoxibacter sp.]
MDTVTKDKKVLDMTAGELQELIEGTIDNKLDKIFEDTYRGKKADRAAAEGFTGDVKSEELLKDLMDAEN